MPEKILRRKGAQVHFFSQTIPFQQNIAFLCDFGAFAGDFVAISG